MEYEPINPLVNEAIQDIERRVGSPLRCPMCGGDEWAALHNRFLRLSTHLDMTEAEIDAASEADLHANVRALALICERCEFVALHAISEEFGAEAG